MVSVSLDVKEPFAVETVTRPVIAPLLTISAILRSIFVAVTPVGVTVTSWKKITTKSPALNPVPVTVNVSVDAREIVVVERPVIVGGAVVTTE
jgi:hypothetical protein